MLALARHRRGFTMERELVTRAPNRATIQPPTTPLTIWRSAPRMANGCEISAPLYEPEEMPNCNYSATLARWQMGLWGGHIIGYSFGRC